MGPKNRAYDSLGLEYPIVQAFPRTDPHIAAGAPELTLLIVLYTIMGTFSQ